MSELSNDALDAILNIVNRKLTEDLERAIPPEVVEARIAAIRREAARRQPTT